MFPDMSRGRLHLSRMRVHDPKVLRAAEVLASLSLVVALQAVASDTAVAKSVTIRVLVASHPRSVKDVPPKTFDLGEWTKGDTYRGTSILYNALRQFGKPKGAPVGTSRFVQTVLSGETYWFDGVFMLPGGTMHARGVMHWVAKNLTVAIVGGTGLYEGATGAVAERVLPNGVPLDVAHLHLP